MLSLCVTHMMVTGAWIGRFWVPHTFCYQSSHLFRVIFGYLPSLLICSFSYSIVEDIKRKIRFIHPNLIYSLHFFLASTRLVGLRNEILPRSCKCHFDYHLSSLFWHPYSLYSLRARGSSFFLCLFQRLLE